MQPLRIKEILIVRSAFHDIYEPAWDRALNELGVKSRIFETHQIIGDGIPARIQQRILWGPAILAVNRILIKKVIEKSPDVLFFYQGHHFHYRTIQRLRFNAFIAGYHNDDFMGPRKKMLRYRFLRKALPSYHGFHVYRECNLQEVLTAGVARAKVLMPYYLPWADYPRELTLEEGKRWSCDIVFAGHAAKDVRIECLSRAARNGFKVNIYGYLPFWKKWLPSDVQSKVRPQWHAEGEDYRKALCGAKIAACFFSRWNRDQYTRRVFEIPACGVFMLAERSPVMQTLYEEGKEAEYFSSPAEFMDKLRFYLRHEDARERIAGAGYRRATTSGYDIYSRMRQWLADVSQWREQLNGTSPC